MGPDAAGGGVGKGGGCSLHIQMPITLGILVRHDFYFRYR